MSSADRAATGELTEIRSDLREVLLYVDDDELSAEIEDWIDESHEESDADTAKEYVERRLNQLLANNPMYHAPDVDRGEDAFPSECSDCRHYGSACPVLTDRVEVRWRERKLEQAETEQEARQIYQRQAIDVSCKRIPEFLEAWDNRHSGFVRRGDELLSRARKSVRGEVAELDEELPETGEVAAGGGR